MKLILRGVGFYTCAALTLYFTLFVIRDLTLTALLLIIPYTLIRYFDLRYNLRRMEVRGRSGFIYIFSDIGQIIPVVKIGRETSQGSRLRAHKTAAPFGMITWCNVYVSDAVAAEAYMHRRYRMWRVSNRNEWFFIVNPFTFIDILLLRFLGS